MKCRFPVKGWLGQHVNPETGLRGVVFDIAEGFADKPMEVPCGQCINCRLTWTGHWATRCEKEASLHSDSCFITFTFSDEHLPRVFSSADGVERSTVDVEEHKLLMKKLRNRYGEGLRFFACGEYGEKSGRAHYHYLVFGLWPPDARLWKKSRGGVDCYVSETLSKLWGKGFVTVQRVNWKACAYVAGYVTKKVTGEAAREAYEAHGINAPFVVMSRRPGIGAEWYERYKLDVFPDGVVLVGENKVRRAAPPYFMQKFRKEDPVAYERVRIRRRVAAQAAAERQVFRDEAMDIKLARSLATRDPA